MLHRWDSDKDDDTRFVCPVLVRKVLACVEDMADHGYRIIVTDGYRTRYQQDRLYAQGRTAPGPIVTRTRQSVHLLGLAVDCAFVDKRGRINWEPAPYGKISGYSLLGHIYRIHGLVWGGDFKRGADLPHAQLLAVAEQGRAFSLYQEVGYSLPVLWGRLQAEGRIPK